MALEKGTEEFMMFGEYFNLCKKYWEVESRQDYCDCLIKDMDGFYCKYKDILLARKMALAFVNAQDLKFKENKA